MSLFNLAYEALICNNVEKKILLIHDLKNIKYHLTLVNLKLI